MDRDNRWKNHINCHLVRFCGKTYTGIFETLPLKAPFFQMYKCDLLIIFQKLILKWLYLGMFKRFINETVMCLFKSRDDV